MSPIAALLQAHRRQKSMRQAELAARIGYEQSYISALEVGLKGPPTPEFIVRFAEALSLSDVERDELSAAAEESNRKLVLEPNASREVYRLVNRLRSSLPTLSPALANAISDILSVASPVKVDLQSRLARSTEAVARKERAM